MSISHAMVHLYYGVINQNFRLLVQIEDYARRKVGEQMKDVCLKLTVKHGGGSIMVWGCLTAHGAVGNIDGIMNAEKFQQILIHHALPFAKCLIGNSFIFQHVWFGLVCWVLWHINLLCAISSQILFMYIYQIYMNRKRLICNLTFLDKPELTCLHTVLLGAILANTRTSI